MCIAALFVAVVVSGMIQQAGAMFGLRLIVHPLIYVAGFLAAHHFVLGKVDKTSWAFVGLDRPALSPRFLTLGLAFGALAIALPVTVFLALGYFDVRAAPDGSWTGTALRASALLLPAAFAEELLTRGYIFAVLKEAAGWRVAAAVTSVAFALLHLANPDGSWLSITVVLLAGLYLSGILLVTGSLYAATAAHFAWNWMIAAGMHMDVSGIPVVGSPDYRIVETGPDWLTGGGWGPEGGLAAVIGLSLGVFVLVLLARRRSIPQGASMNG